MNSIIAYPTPQAFMVASQATLERKDMENNLIMGICNNIPDPSVPQDGFVFLNSIADDQIQATFMKTNLKGIVSGSSRDVAHIRPLARYCLDHGIDLKSVVGEAFYVRHFSDCYGKPSATEKNLILHRLTTVNPLPLSQGEMRAATLDDFDLVTDWSIKFEEEAQNFPKRSRDEHARTVMERLTAGTLFKWVVKGEIVAIAAIVRQTRHTGFIGLVYTPHAQRGNGYATSLVRLLSEYIFGQGYQQCGLFTDQSNPISNSIYRKIGYLPITEFLDIGFAQQ